MATEEHLTTLFQQVARSYGDPLAPPETRGVLEISPNPRPHPSNNFQMATKRYDAHPAMCPHWPANFAENVSTRASTIEHGFVGIVGAW